jgi:hypothetical protein
MVRLRNSVLGVAVLAVIVLLFVGAGSTTTKSAANPQWAMNGTIIEACSCPMFCQCYFNPEPAVHSGNEGIHAGHESGHYCRFNNAFKVNKGNYGATKLDGAKFWVAGDLGGDFRKGQMDWAVLTFDPSVTKSQRDGIVAIVGKLYPAQFKSFTIAQDQPMTWKAGKDSAVAKLDNGKVAEVSLTRFQGMSNAPVVIKNLKYWGAQSNDGFVLMPNTVEAYRAGDKPFEYKGTNGFMITFDIKG